MKFWQKAFIGILGVFILSINFCLYLTSQYSFSLNMKKDVDRAIGEYHFIINGVYENISSIYYRDQALPIPASIGSLMSSYANYYKNQSVYLELEESNTRLFTNIPFAVTPETDADELKQQGVYKTKVYNTNGGNYLFVVGNLSGQYKDYTLTYVRDLSDLYSAHDQLTRYLIIVSASVETILAIVLLLILRKLTHPIRIMQKATRRISGGVYDGRISVPGKDEFHDLAENFNQMASSIQEKIEELNKNAQDKQRLIDNLAHELRTPLTAIRGYAEYLQNANTSEQNRMIASGYIVSEIDRMKNLAFKLLDLALLRNNQLDLMEIDPSELLNEVKAASELKLKEKNLSLNIHSTLDRLTGDSILLQSLLVNLIDNAMKASHNGSQIELSAYFDKVPILEVKDFGCGMKEEQTALVCEPFYRVDKARSRSSGGVGLGLSICSEIVHLHSAELTIDSVPERGTTIKILFTTSLQPPENSVIHKEV